MMDAVVQPYTDGADYDSSTYWGAEKTFAETFADSVGQAVSSIHSKSCTDRIKDLFPNASDTAEGIYDNLYNNLNVGHAIELLGDNIDFIDYGKNKVVVLDPLTQAPIDKYTDHNFSICVTFSMWWRYIRFYLDSILKTAIVLFKKIDKARELIEESMVDLIYAIKNCLTTMIIKLKNDLNALINKIFDFSVFLDIFIDCPCLLSLFSDILGCELPEGGNINDKANALMKCIKDSLPFNEDDINKVINDAVYAMTAGFIDPLFKNVETLIRFAMSVLIYPFRYLIRLYIKLLTKKIDVTTMINGLGSAECFFVYTNEYTSGGREYKGMSVIDMFETMKGWASCFESICSTFSADIRNEIKKYNKEFRIGDRYWNSVYSMDLYQACISTKAQARQTTGTYWRELTCKNNEEGGISLMNELAVSVGHMVNSEMNTIVPAPSEEYKASMPSKYGAVARAYEFRNGPDTETTNVSMNPNGKEFPTTGVKRSITEIAKNLGVYAPTDTFYEEALLNYVNALSGYRKGGDLYKALTEANSSVEDAMRRPNRAPKTVSMLKFKKNSENEYDNEGYIKYPNYRLEDDYSEDEVNSILDKKMAYMGNTDDVGKFVSGTIAALV